MSAKPPASRAAGAIIALTTIAGAVIGNAEGQPSLGMVIGFAIGAAVAVGLWVYDRR